MNFNIKPLIKEIWGISNLDNDSFSKMCMGHVLHKNSLGIKKRGPFRIVVIKFIKIRIFFAIVTVRKLTIGNFCIYY